MSQPNKNTEKKTGVYKNLLSGGLSAAIARTVINPIERVEILRQVENADYKHLSLSESVVKFYKTEGILGLLKGNSASVARVFPYSSIEFFSMEFYKNIFLRGENNNTRSTSFGYTFLCGALSGLNAITITFPLDVARTRLSINTPNSNLKETGLFRTLLFLIKNEGIRGVYKGYSFAFIGSIPYVAIKQTTYEQMKNFYMNQKYRGLLNWVYGATSGLIGTVILYPTYFLKRILQANNKEFKMGPYLKELFQRQGVKGFYQGLSMSLIKIVPYNGLIFLINDYLKILMKYEK